MFLRNSNPKYGDIDNPFCSIHTWSWEDRGSNANWGVSPMQLSHHCKASRNFCKSYGAGTETEPNLHRQMDSLGVEMVRMHGDSKGSGTCLHFGLLIFLQVFGSSQVSSHFSHFESWISTTRNHSDRRPPPELHPDGTAARDVPASMKPAHDVPGIKKTTCNPLGWVVRCCWWLLIHFEETLAF